MEKFTDLIKSRFPEKIYVIKVNNRDTENTFKICSNLTMQTLEWRH